MKGLPLPNSNDPAELRRVFAAWAARIQELESSSTTTIIQGAGGADGARGKNGTSAEDLTDYLMPDEKVTYKGRWDSYTAEKPTLDAQAAAVGADSGPYDLAYTNLSNYLTDHVGDVYEFGGKSYPVSGWNTLDSNKKYLGPMGKRNWMQKWGTFEATRAALVVLIQQGGIDLGAQTDTFRPALFWDLGDGSDAGFTYSGGTAADSSTPYGKVSRDLTWTAGSLMALSPDFSGSNLDGRATRVVMARIRLNSGTWVGKVHFKGASPAIVVTATNKWHQIAAPKVGEWVDVAWDMANLTVASTDYVANTNIQQIQFELLSSAGSVSIDWAAVGTYGSGSLADYQNAVSWSATNALLTSNFQGIMQGQGLNIPKMYTPYPSGFPTAAAAGNGFLAMDSASGILYRSNGSAWIVVTGTAGTSLWPNAVVAGTVVAGVIGANEIAANAIYSKHIVLANFDNLIPNPGSEMDLTGWPSGCIESVGVSSYAGHSGTRSREVWQGTPLTITKDIPVVPGEIFSMAGWTGLQQGGSYPYSSDKTIKVFWKNYAGTATLLASWTNIASLTPDSGWSLLGGQFTIPAGTASIYVVLDVSGNVGAKAYFDDLYLRRAADASLIVDGSISAQKIVSGAVQSYHLAVGPLYQFQSNTNDSHGSKAMGSFNDGTMGPNDSGRKNYVDITRVYPTPSATVGTNTFEANFTGTSGSARGILFNLASAWGNGMILVQTATAITLNDYTGSPSGDGTIGTQRGTYSYTRNQTDKLSVVVSADGSGVINCYLNGVKIITYGATAAGGFSGIYLDHATDRVWGIGMGRGFVTIQDGTVTADKIAADLVTANVIRGTNYNGDASTVCTTGFKISGTTYSAKPVSGANIMVSAEFGGDVIIAGYKAMTLADRIMLNATATGSSGSSVSNTSDVDYLMAGAGFSITPGGSGNVLVIATSRFSFNSVSCGIDTQIYYGTGTAPSAGAAATGTVATGSHDFTPTTGISVVVPGVLIAVVTGLSPGTTYWFDLGFKTGHWLDNRSPAGTASIYSGAKAVLFEI